MTAADIGFAVANSLVSLGGLAGVIVWTVQPDNYRGITNDGYGLYWFITIASSIWGIMSVFGYSLPAERWIFPRIANHDRVFSWVSLFFIGVWIAAVAKVATYLNFCIIDLKSSTDDNFQCNGEIISTAFGSAAIAVWILTLLRHVYRENNIQFSLAAWEFTLVVINLLLSLGGLAGIIVWTVQPDRYRNLDNDGYGLYWFTCIASTIWGILSFFNHLVPSIFPQFSDSNNLLVWVSVFFIAIWVASLSKVATYLNFCISDLNASTDDNFQCNGEIITTTFGSAVVIVWLLTFGNYFFKVHGFKSPEVDITKV